MSSRRVRSVGDSATTVRRSGVRATCGYAPQTTTARAPVTKMHDEAPIQRPPETGWLVDTPVSDNLLRQFLHNQADVCERIAEGFDGEVA